MSEEQRDRVEINWVQVSGSALAAVTSAVLLSTVGVAGTIIGAAVASVFATAGSAIYQHYLRVSRERVARAQAAARDRVQRARQVISTPTRVNVRRADSGSVSTPTAQQAASTADDELEQAEHEMDSAEDEAAATSWREVLAGLAWQRIARLTAAVFLVAMLVIVGFELIAGTSVSTLTGGSSGGGHRTSLGFGSSTSAKKTPTPTPSPDASNDGSADPSAPASSRAPTSSGTPTGTAAQTPTRGPTSGSATASSAPSSASPGRSPGRSPSAGVTRPPTAAPSR